MNDFLVLVLLLIIAIIDIKKKTIHNKSSLLTLLIGLFLYKKIYLTGLLLAVLILIICLFIDENYKGGGDIKFIGVIGLLKGFYFTMEFYIISEVLCIIYRKITKKGKKEEIAYAPFMFLSFLLSIKL